MAELLDIGVYEDAYPDQMDTEAVESTWQDKPEIEEVLQAVEEIGFLETGELHYSQFGDGRWLVVCKASDSPIPGE